MNRSLLAATLLATFTAALHTLGGTPEIETPLLQSGMQPQVSLLLLACWHLVTAALTLSAMTLGWALWGAPASAMAQVRLVSYLWLGFGAVFMGIDVAYGGLAMLWQLPQWVLLLPVGVLGLWGVRSHAHVYG